MNGHLRSDPQDAQWHALAARYRVPLRRYFARRLRAIPDPDDLVQEVFVRLVRQGHFDAIRNLDGFIFTVAANVLRDHLRRWSIRAEELNHEQLEDHLIEGGFTPERVLQGEEALMCMIAALQELPEKTQGIFALYHFESVPQVEIARRLGTTASSIEKHMARASAHLLLRLSERA